MKLLRRLARWPWRHRDDVFLAEELEHHRALIQADLESGGMPAAEADAASRRAMGNISLAREDARDLWVAGWADRLSRDAIGGLRSLRREPTFALTAIATLALGVLTTTTVFSVADAELWKPLPFPQADRLVAITSVGPAGRADGVSGADLIDWRAGAPALADLAAVGRTGRQVLRLDRAESIVVTEVTANYFVALGRSAVEGRVFADGERRGTAILTDRALGRLFGADTSVVGRSVMLDDHVVTIAGIVRADDTLGGDPDLFVALDEGAASFLDRTEPIAYWAIGKLRPRATAAEAQAQLQGVAARVAQVHATGLGDSRIEVEDLGESFAGYNWRPLYFFMAASLVVLLLSAVNVATLLLGRAVRRSREFALRGALGGGHPALARQLLVEGALIAVPGGALGVVLSIWTIALVTSALPADFLARGANIPIDLRVCGFALAVTVVTTIVFALAPLPLARRVDLASTLGGIRAGRSPMEGRSRAVLLTVQIALTVILLCGAAIFLKSFMTLSRVPLGFDPVNLAALRVSLSGTRYQTDTAIVAYAAALADGARAVPGVRDVAVASSSPLGSGPLVLFERGDRARPAAGEGARAILRAASPGFFQTLGIPILRGRAFAADDGPGAPRVAIVNATLAALMFEGDEPLGRTIELLPGARAPWTRRPGPLRIVGVAANAKEVGLKEVEFPDIYVPFAQAPPPGIELIVRTAVAPAQLADTLRARAAQLDPAMPVTSVSTFEQRVSNALRGDRFNVLLVSGFATVAIVLAAIGIYGAVSYHVQARTREFGVRLALGARPAALVLAALWRTGRLAVIGGLAGLGATLALARIIGNALYVVPGEHDGLLYGVTTTDPAMLTSALAGVIFVAALAGALPARQVTRVDPVRALRNE